MFLQHRSSSCHAWRNIHRFGDGGAAQALLYVCMHVMDGMAWDGMEWGHVHVCGGCVAARARNTCARDANITTQHQN